MKTTIVSIPNITIKYYKGIEGYYPGHIYHLYINGVLEQAFFDKKSLLDRLMLMVNNEVNSLDLMDVDFPNSSVKGGNADNTGTDINDLFSNF